MNPQEAKKFRPSAFSPKRCDFFSSLLGRGDDLGKGDSQKRTNQIQR
jgi:hypothetical protein